MSPIKILVIFGTRPEAIKLAPVIQLIKRNSRFKSIVCVTGQHRQMLDQVLKAFDIHPDIDLDLMTPYQDLFLITSSILLEIKNVLSKTSPSMVLVQGDTTTCFAAALGAYYCKIPVAHVEAGLRSHDLYAPFPEEANRILVSDLAQLHFAPTEEARQNLLKENISSQAIFVTGNTGIDALKHMQKQLPEFIPEILKSILASKKSIILVTGHRRESFEIYLQAICEALKIIARQNPDWNIVYPVHLNPNVQNVVKSLLSGISNIYLTDPLDYPVFVHLMSVAKFIISDSGGIQEEAPALGKPILVTRDVTERPEAIETGHSVLVGRDVAMIVKTAESLMHNQTKYNAMAQPANIYGDGLASERVVSAIEKYFRKTSG